MNAKESVAAYCRAQSDINKIEKVSEEQKKTLNERIKTCRSLITDELSSKNISCIEVYGDDETEPLYFRLKAPMPNMNICMDDIVQILNNMNTSILNSCAEKYNHDFPKMVSSTIQSLIRDEKKKNYVDKSTLSISSNKERGYTRDLNQNVSNNTLQIAKDLLTARKELSGLKQNASEQKKQCMNTQKEVETTVKEALKTSDPKNMTTRVHMMQGDSEWVYYLRCKETTKAPPLGIRKLVPIVEKAVVSLLDETGLSREYNEAQKIDAAFWNNLCNRISNEVDIFYKKTKTTSKLSLDRGAPRQRK
tara:strand:- start:363 stop:1280 length:918 start_codon:yes stop_codon:yes gene_type:complete